MPKTALSRTGTTLAKGTPAPKNRTIGTSSTYSTDAIRRIAKKAKAIHVVASRRARRTACRRVIRPSRFATSSASPKPSACWSSACTVGDRRSGDTAGFRPLTPEPALLPLPVSARDTVCAGLSLIDRRLLLFAASYDPPDRPPRCIRGGAGSHTRRQEGKRSDGANRATGDSMKEDGSRGVGDGAAILSQEAERWGALYERLRPNLVRALAAAAGSYDGVEDAIQDAFVAALANAPEDLRSPEAWLFVVGLNKLRKQQRRSRLAARLRLVRPPGPHELDDALNRADVLTTLQQLSSRERTLLVAKYYV